MLRLFAVLIAALLFVAGPARADWQKAESERFIVYSQGGATQLTAFVQKLETFDRLLRWRMGLDAEEPPVRKLSIYLVDGIAGINAVSPSAGYAGVAGFYRANPDAIFAVAIRGGMGDDVLLHEYAHHFMLQYFPYGYPAWFVEGFAEYFATVDIGPESIVVGHYNRNRTEWLRTTPWLPTRELLTKRAGQVSRRRETYYPVAWLLTHWFMGNEERRLKLNAYLLAVGDGENAADAMTRITGLSSRGLRAELRDYMGRLPYYELRNTFPQAQVTVTSLPAWADDLLLLSLRVGGEVPESRRADALADARRAVARYPDEPFAQVMLGQIEARYGDVARGESILQAVADAHPDNVEAPLQLATSLLRRAAADEAGAPALKARAQALLARAYRLDDADYRIFMGLGAVRQGAPGWPNENDIVTRELALTLAPQVDEARLALAEAYLAAGHNEDAIRTARPLANDPHAEEMATKGRELIARARGLTEAEAAAEEAATAEDDDSGE